MSNSFKIRIGHLKDKLDTDRWNHDLLHENKSKIYTLNKNILLFRLWVKLARTLNKARKNIIDITKAWSLPLFSHIFYVSFATSYKKKFSPLPFFQLFVAQYFEFIPSHSFHCITTSYCLTVTSRTSYLLLRL